MENGQGASTAVLLAVQSRPLVQRQLNKRCNGNGCKEDAKMVCANQQCMRWLCSNCVPWMVGGDLGDWYCCIHRTTDFGCRCQT